MQVWKWQFTCLPPVVDAWENVDDTTPFSPLLGQLPGNALVQAACVQLSAVAACVQF